MLDAILSGLITGYAIAIPVGAVAAFIISLTARTSWRIGAGAALGVATVDGVYATIAVLAGKAVAEVVTPVAGTLKIVAAVVLLVVAAVTARNALRRTGTVEDTHHGTWTPVKAFVMFVGITAVNPATVVYFVAIVMGGRAELGQASYSVAFVVAAFVASASWQLFLAAAGTGLGRVLAGPRGHRITGLVGAAVIAGLALQTLLS